MATAQDVLNRAAGLLNLLVPGTAFSSTDSSLNAEGLEILQNMIAEWGEDGLVDIPVPASTATTLAVPAGAIRALAYNLAIDWGAEIGKALDPRVARIAAETRSRLAGQSDVDLEVDMGDVPGVRRWRSNIETDR